MLTVDISATQYIDIFEIMSALDNVSKLFLTKILAISYKLLLIISYISFAEFLYIKS